MRMYVTNGPRNGLDSVRKVGSCPGSRRRWVLGIGLHMRLPLPILCGVYCNSGVLGGNVILRNRVGDDGAGWGA